MKALLIAAGVAALSSTAMAAKLDEKVPYPKADAGFTRQVIHLPKQDAEDAVSYTHLRAHETLA
ncbi:hypothetical protein FA392_25735, partial [Pseudomonas aeruginosa]|nr:hypothetical protein [Pseudomonas aeruginosa]